MLIPKIKSTMRLTSEFAKAQYSDRRYDWKREPKTVKLSEIVDKCSVDEFRYVRRTFIQEHTFITEKLGYPKLCFNWVHVLLIKLRRAFQNRRRGKLSLEVILLHVYARPHTVALIKRNIKDFLWKLYDYPSYCPDLASSGHFLSFCLT